MEEARARDYPAKYAPSLWREIEKTVEFGEDEEIQAYGRARRKVYWFYSPICALAITNQRLIALVHHAFSPDRVFDIPLGSVLELQQRKPSGVGVVYNGPDGQNVFQLFPFRGPALTVFALQKMDLLFVKKDKYREKFKDLIVELEKSLDRFKRAK